MKRLARYTSMIVLLALAVGMLTATPAVAASTGADGRYADVQARLAQAQAQIAAAKQREADLGLQVAGFDAQLGVLDDSLARLDAQIAHVRGKLERTRARLVKARAGLRLAAAKLRATTATLVVQQGLFECRVVAMYKKDDVSYFDVLLGSNGWEDLVSRIELVRTVINADNDLVGELQALRDEVSAQKRELAASEADLASAEADLAKQNDRLAALRAEAVAQEQSLAAARAAKSGLLEQVATNRRQWEAQEDQLQAESSQLAAIIAGGGDGDAHGTGQLIWPVNGTVSSGFGWRIHPIFNVRKFHTGIDIAAAYGTEIKSADGGTTVYAGWMTGYGNVVVVDHGRGLSTLYAHMSVVAAANGVDVSRGQTLGNVGATGYATGPHLHFEVRVDGDPVDPLGYLP